MAVEQLEQAGARQHGLRAARGDELEQTHFGAAHARHRGARAVDLPDLARQPLVEDMRGTFDDRGLQRHAVFGLDPEHRFGEGQPGIALDEFLDGDVDPRLGQKLGVDARGNDFRIDEHAVAVEDDQVGLGHGASICGVRSAGRWMAGAI